MNKSFSQIKYLVIDVDGTMTDGSIYYDNNGNEYKKFNTKDAAGFFACKKVGIHTIVITGRECKATERRMKELDVDFLFQNIKNKKIFLQLFMLENGIDKSEIGYIGDDLNDCFAMKLVSFIACPLDGCEEIRSIANYVSCKNGGCGAVRDCVEYILKKDNRWCETISTIYDCSGF